MGTWVLPILETSSLLMVAWCVADAWRRGPRYVMELIAGALFGMALEQIAIWSGSAAGRPDAYRYGAFTWMATPDVPLVVVATWGALLYAAMRYSDGLMIPRWMQPAADGLYALMLDLTMEVVAVKLGLWTWATPRGAQWFGVPFSNFGGWLVMAVLFSASVRAVRDLTAQRGALVYAGFLAVLAGLLPFTTLWVLGRLFTGTSGDVWPLGALALMAAGVLCLGLAQRRAEGFRPPGSAGAAAAAPNYGWPDPSIWLPVVWHLTYLGTAVLFGLLTNESATLFITGTMAVVGILLVIGLAPTAGK